MVLFDLNLKDFQAKKIIEKRASLNVKETALNCNKRK